MQIKDKRVIVIGGASALGYVFGRELLRNGASRVAVIDIRAEKGQQSANLLNEEFGRNRAFFFGCDVANSTEFCAAFKKAISALGGLEILVNNVGIVNETNYTKTIDVNVTAVIRSTLLGIEQMQRDLGGKGGVIVNISSVAGLHSIPQFPVYSATKHAVVSFSRSFAQPYHYQRTGVRVLVLCPAFSGNVLTDLPEGEELQKIEPQKVQTVAHGLVYIIRCARNGSIWVSEDNKPVFEIQMPDTLPQKMEDFFLEENMLKAE